VFGETVLLPTAEGGLSLASGRTSSKSDSIMTTQASAQDQ
jgi:hypothetical protein